MDVPAHSQPGTKEEYIATWKARRRIHVPTKNGKIMDMLIIHLVEAMAVDGIPVDLVIEARASKRGPLRRFAVVFSDREPADDYTIPTLWMKGGIGVWLQPLQP